MKSRCGIACDFSRSYIRARIPTRESTRILREVHESRAGHAHDGRLGDTPTARSGRAAGAPRPAFVRDAPLARRPLVAPTPPRRDDEPRWAHRPRRRTDPRCSHEMIGPRRRDTLGRRLASGALALAVSVVPARRAHLVAPRARVTSRRVGRPVHRMDALQHRRTRLHAVEARRALPPTMRHRSARAADRPTAHLVRGRVVSAV